MSFGEAEQCTLSIKLSFSTFSTISPPEIGRISAWFNFLWRRLIALPSGRDKSCSEADLGLNPVFKVSQHSPSRARSIAMAQDGTVPAWKYGPVHKNSTPEPKSAKGTLTTLTTVIKIEVFVTVRAVPGRNVITNAIEVASP
jgi:hypothetical protein